MARDRLRKLRPPTDAQRLARARNRSIWMLRGMYWNSRPLHGELLTEYRSLIDRALADLGAEPETERHERKAREAERYEKFRAALVGEFNV